MFAFFKKKVEPTTYTNRGKQIGFDGYLNLMRASEQLGQGLSRSKYKRAMKSFDRNYGKKWFNKRHKLI